MKRLLLLVSALFFVGCSSEGVETNNSLSPAEYKMEIDEVQPDYMEEEVQDTDVSSGNIREGENTKFIESFEINSETKNYDKAVNDINALIEKYDGYVTNVSEGGVIPRYIYMEVKIPKSQTDAFLNDLQVSEELVVYNKVKSSTDITDVYRDNELRLKNLEKKLERLYELQANQDNIKDLLEVEVEIDETTFEIENIKNQQSNYDTLTSYSQISVNLNEVATDNKAPSKVEISFIERLKDAFERSGKNFIEGVKNLIILLVLNIIPIIIILIIIFAIYKFVKKRKAETNPLGIKYKDEEKKNEDLK